MEGTNKTEQPAAENRFDKVFRYRWAIGLAIFLLTVALGINGSSVGMWNVYVPNASDPKADVIIGRNRGIRSDEWCVFTPMAMSQYYNDFNYTSDVLRGTETDVYMVYGQPVRDWSILFRPFQAGYLFLDQGRGLSFYWMGKLIFLFLVSIEFGLLLTKRKKLTAIAWAFALTLAPVVQWWFSTNAFPDMLLYGQGIALCLNGYMETVSRKKRAVFALGLSWLGGCYLLVIYPAWQIPFFYVFLAVCLWVILSHRKTFTFQKTDIALLGGAVILLALSMGLLYNRSRDAVQAVMNSVYPGARMETGGIGANDFFRYPGNMFFFWRDEIAQSNVCEMSSFFDLFPLGLVGAAVSLCRGKKKDGLTIALLAVLAFLGIYTVFGFPAWLSRVTLMSNCQAGRVVVAVSFLNLLLLFRTLALAEEEKLRLPLPVTIPLALVLGAGAALLSRTLIYHEYLTPAMLAVCAVVLAVLFWTAFAHRKAFCIGLCVLSLAVGGTVNPIRRGVSSLTETAPARAIQQISSENEGKWLAVSPDWVIGDYLIANGAHTLNNTNTYVNREFWKVLDPEGACEKVYNRYAHIIAGLTDLEEPVITLLSADLIRVEIPISRLKELGVEFLFSNDDLSMYDTDRYQFRNLFSDDDGIYRIYRLTEDSEES